MKRREFLKAIAAIPIAGLVALGNPIERCTEIVFQGGVIGSVKGNNLQGFQWQGSDCRNFSNYTVIGDGPKLTQKDLKGYTYLRFSVNEVGPSENMIHLSGELP